MPRTAIVTAQADDKNDVSPLLSPISTSKLKNRISAFGSAVPGPNVCVGRFGNINMTINTRTSMVVSLNPFCRRVSRMVISTQKTSPVYAAITRWSRVLSTQAAGFTSDRYKSMGIYMHRTNRSPVPLYFLKPY